MFRKRKVRPLIAENAQEKAAEFSKEISNSFEVFFAIRVLVAKKKLWVGYVEAMSLSKPEHETNISVEDLRGVTGAFLDELPNYYLTMQKEAHDHMSHWLSALEQVDPEAKNMLLGNIDTRLLVVQNELSERAKHYSDALLNAVSITTAITERT